MVERSLVTIHSRLANMNFKQFLTETKKTGGRYERPATLRSQPTSMLEAIDFIATNCSEILNSYKNGTKRLYRGVKIKSDFLYADSTSKKRMSQNTQNYYTLIMDNSKKWEKFPKRSESFICTTLYSSATSYGEVYVAFPINGTIIAECPQRDMWYSGEGKFWLPDLNEAYENIAKKFKIKLNENNYDIFKKQLDDLSTKLTPEKMNSITMDMDVEKYLLKDKNYKNLYQAYEQCLNPDRFNLTNTSNFYQKSKKGDREHECWFSGPAVFMTTDNIHIVTHNIGKWSKAGKPEIYLKIDELIKELT